MNTQELKLTDAEKKYLVDTMNKVSRSFSIVIPSLEEPLNYCMATAYLLGRVVDNIEDCTQPFAWKQQRFGEFHQLIEEPASAPQILAVWSQESWPGLTQDESEMMGEVAGLSLWEIYARDTGEEPLHHQALDVRDGRWHASCRRSRSASGAGKPRRSPHLAAESDYNEYCFYVAGTVGHMATELVVVHYGLAEDVTAKLLATCDACGRGLQKTNIVKGFAEDLGRGISYLPYTWHREADFAPLSLAGAPVQWKKKVIDDVVRELHDAAEYVLALPYDAAGYRMASLMIMLPAYQTMLLAAKRHDTLFTSGHHVKISRPTLAKCQWDAHSMLTDNDAVRRYRRRLEGEIDAVMRRQQPVSTHERSADPTKTEVKPNHG